MGKSRGVLIFGAVLAALQFLAAATALADIVGKTEFAMFVIAVGAIQVGWSAYQQSLVTPNRDIGAFMDANGNMVAGPAAGATNGTPVLIEPGTITPEMVEDVVGKHEAPPGPPNPERDPRDRPVG